MGTETFTITRRTAWAFLGEIKVEIACDPLTGAATRMKDLGIKAARKAKAVAA